MTANELRNALAGLPDDTPVYAMADPGEILRPLRLFICDDDDAAEYTGYPLPSAVLELGEEVAI